MTSVHMASLCGSSFDLLRRTETLSVCLGKGLDLGLAIQLALHTTIGETCRVWHSKYYSAIGAM